MPQFFFSGRIQFVSFCLFSLTIIPALMQPAPANAKQVLVAAQLTEGNWKQFVPAGKEVDAIVGDWVIKNDKIVAVIAAPLKTRNANMTVRNVGGSVIDLSSFAKTQNQGNDQLSCFYPGAGQFFFRDGEAHIQYMDDTGELVAAELAKRIVINFQGKILAKKLKVDLAYELKSGERALTVKTKVTSESNKPLSFIRRDSIRADRSFQFGVDTQRNMIWAADEWFHQTVGIVSEPAFLLKRTKLNGVIWDYESDGVSEVILNPQESTEWTRKLIPATNQLELTGFVDADYGKRNLNEVVFSINDKRGPVADAKLTLKQGSETIGAARTDSGGKVLTQLLAGIYQAEIKSNGRSDLRQEVKISESGEIELVVEELGIVQGKIVDGNGRPIACKIAFHGIDGTKDPFFGPDTRARSVHNVHYSAQGDFKQTLGPGNYEVLFSHGPEYDAELKKIVVERGQLTEVETTLNRVVDSKGWVSTEYHSHSSPSGDNTSDQLGRVLNLLAEHIEFAPCTEHNRIDSYEPHLVALGVTSQMATCTGMELTGNPLPINHQNAFPLIHRPRTQDGGGPVTHANSLIQIERLAMWDQSSPKLVQMNHPNLFQIAGDRNNDGRADDGFQKMFSFTDAIEVHPLSNILRKTVDRPAPGKRGNTIFHWLQLLNQGVRIPGVVNTDAHYNFHGSGWLRNYVMSSTDDPVGIQTIEMVKSTEKGRVMMTNGPFLEAIAINSENEGMMPGLLGDEMKSDSGEFGLLIKVQCANWLDINRVQVLINGEPVPELNFTRRNNSDMFKNGVFKFDHEIPISLKTDSHLIVVAVGEGLQLGRVMGPTHGKRIPIAVTNPIFVDVGGDGFQPNRNKLGAPFPVGNGE